jgi:hypothetical protein
MTWAETELRSSAISVIVAVPPVTEVTFPASPSPVITGWSTAMPSPEPLLIWTLDHHTVGERAITRAVTGAVP